MVQYSADISTAFAALADPTRRGILTRLGRSDAAISELADAFGMSLTGVKKHVQVLEAAGLVRTLKIGRVRHCRLGTRHLDRAADWIAAYHTALAARMDRLGDFLEHTKEPS